MGRSLFGLTAALAAASALQPAAAQDAQPANVHQPWDATLSASYPVTAGRWNSGIVGPWNSGAIGPWATGASEMWRTQTEAPAPVGFEPAPGITFVPKAFSETGYDTNPAQSLSDAKGSAFGRTGAGFNLSSVSPGTIASLNAAGSFLDYLNDAAFTDSTRYAGSANTSITYLVRPGVTVSSGAFINYDGESANKTQSDGATAELGYGGNLVASSLRLSFKQVEYLNGEGVANNPLVLSSAYNYSRSDITWVGLLGRGWAASPYVEVSGARVDYTDQSDPAAVDRSANDYHAKAGLRLHLSPELTTDVGWRVNWRDTEDRQVGSYDSDGFDGSLTWRPSPFFNLTAAVERYIGEPSTSMGVLADVRSYSVKAGYLPVPGVTVSAAAGWQIATDIGSGVGYRMDYAGAQFTWDYSSHVQFYTTANYQTYDIKWQDSGYNELRVASGVRIIPDGQALFTGESVQSLVERLGFAGTPSGSQLSVSTGYSWVGLPDMKMVTVMSPPVAGPGTMPSQALWQQTNASSADGLRTDLRLANFAEGALPDGRLLSFGLSGFYANYQSGTHTHCMYTVTTDCAIVNIVDFSFTQPNNTGLGGELNVAVHRNVDYYGTAVDVRWGDWAGGGQKDGPRAEALSPFRLGVAMRGISETANLTSVDPQVSAPAKYKENLDTQYYGGFAGFEHEHGLGDGWSVHLDATAGVYYTTVDYQGRYTGYTLLIPTGYFEEYGSVNSGLERASFIGSVRLDLKQQLGWGAIGLYGQGEYLSYVPRIAYNNNDQASGYLLGGVNGTQSGTRIASGDAFNFTAGLNVSVPVN